MTRFVVDASVAVKWFVPEIFSEPAGSLLANEFELHVPDLLFPEFGNILWKKVRRNELTEGEARTIARALGVVPLVVHPSGPLLEAALDLALGVSRTVYDCLYLVLAESLTCSMVTADERLYNALQTSPFAHRLTLVQNL